MKEGFRQSMAWLHTWLGLVTGWLLFYVYLTGTLGYLDKEIDYWMTPDKKFFAAQPTTREQLALAQTRLSAVAADAQTWKIQLIGGREAPWLEINWTQQPTDSSARAVPKRETLHPVTGEPFDNSARATGGGQLLYRMHYSLAYMTLDTAIYIIMFASMIMFTAMLAGIVAHKNIFKDFFTFRPGKGQRSWLDGHNLLSVTSLPFHLIVTYSGLLFFVYKVLPGVPDIVFDPQPGLTVEQQVYRGANRTGGATIPAVAGVAAPLASLAPMLDEVDRVWGANKLTTVDVRNPGDANARVIFKPLPSDTVTIPDNGLLFDGVSGTLVEDFIEPYPFAVVDQVLKGIHRGLFAGPFLRVLYLFMGLAGTAMIGTGLLLWSNKRKTKLLARNQNSHAGIVLVDTLNLGTIVGLPIAIAAYFWANRLLPVAMATRSAWEVHAMYLTLLVCFLYPRLRPLQKAWVELLWLAAAAIGLLPLLNALTTQRHLGVSLAQGDWIMAGFDLTALATGLVFAVFAYRLQPIRSSNAAIYTAN
jgi:uncharacterized iron-regulated membrane protein